MGYFGKTSLNKKSQASVALSHSLTYLSLLPGEKTHRIIIAKSYSFFPTYFKILMSTII
jgi:hypothetical protein